MGGMASDGAVLLGDTKVIDADTHTVTFRKKMFQDYYPIVLAPSGSTILSGKFRQEAHRAILERARTLDRASPPMTLGAVTIIPVKESRNSIDFLAYLKELEAITERTNAEYAGRVHGDFDILVATQGVGRGADLYYIYPDGVSSYIDTYKAIGTGAPHGSLFLKKFWRQDMSMLEVARLGFFVLRLIEKFDLDVNVGTNPWPQIWFIPNKGEVHEEDLSVMESFQRFADERLSKLDFELLTMLGPTFWG
jgi:hypothetical protein